MGGDDVAPREEAHEEELARPWPGVRERRTRHPHARHPPGLRHDRAHPRRVPEHAQERQHHAPREQGRGGARVEEHPGGAGRRVGDEVRARRDLVREREVHPGVDRQVHEEPRLVRQVPPHEARAGHPHDHEQAGADQRGRHVRLRQHEGERLPPGRGLRRQGGPDHHEERVREDEEHDGRPEDAVPRDEPVQAHRTLEPGHAPDEEELGADQHRRDEPHELPHAGERAGRGRPGGRRRAPPPERDDEHEDTDQHRPQDDRARSGCARSAPCPGRGPVLRLGLLGLLGLRGRRPARREDAHARQRARRFSEHSRRRCR